MKNKILLEVIIVLSVIYGIIGSTNKKESTSFFVPDVVTSPHIVRVKNTITSDVTSYPIEEYLEGVLAGEMPASFEMEALKAQAVASRTYAYNKILNEKKDYDITNDTTSQVHLTTEQMKEKWQGDYDFYLNKIKEAIKSTENEVLTYDGKVIKSYYYALSNGYTEDSIYAFNETHDYLKVVSSTEDMQNENFEVTTSFTKEEFCSYLNINCPSAIIISDINLTPSKRVNYLYINGQKFSGDEVRSNLGLRSTDFKINVGTNIDITTKGFGHGVGMSQYGAHYLAQSGLDYKEILAHYYLNTNLEKIDSIK